MQRPTRLVSLLPFLAAFLANTTAQAPPAWNWRPVPMPAPFAGAAPSQVVAGNFTGHGYPDLAFLAGNQVGLLSAPAVHNALDAILPGMVANGLANLRGGGSQGRDALAIATASGVYEWRVGEPPTLLVGGAWRSLVVGNLDLAGDLDLVGVTNPARDLLLVRMRALSEQTLQIPFPGETIAAVQLAQWDGVGGLEICVATNQRLWVGRADATTVFQLPFPNGGRSLLARVAMPGHDSLAWLATGSGDGVQRLTTLSSLGQACDPAIQPGVVRELTSGDFDGDLRGDLLLATVGSNELRLLTNVEGVTGILPGVAQFLNAPQSMAPVGLQLAGSTLSCGWVGDLNADGHSDVVAMQMPGNVAWIGRRIPAPGYVSYRPVLGGSLDPEPLGNGVFQCTVPLAPTSVRPEDATHLEVLLFGAVVGPASTLILQPTGLDRLRFAGNPQSFTFDEALAATESRALVGVARWIRVEGDRTVNLWAPTRFAFAWNGMRVTLDSWWQNGLLKVTDGPFFWPPVGGGSDYFWRELLESGGSASIGPTRGFEEPPDLPPKPPEPPTPPVPPAPPVGG